tara:strand:+ start:58 stop:1191 length:1134 start_codon:yes stop_codon:yes gene_type:complete
MKICIEGWRNINHSYAMVNQYQLLQLLNYPIKLKHKDIIFHNENWNKLENSNGFNENINNILGSIPSPDKDEIFDVIYRITYPFNFEKSNSKKLFVFGTAETKNIEKKFINENPNNFNKREDLKIVTPSNWSKEGFLIHGFDEQQVYIIPHGVDVKSFFPVSSQQKINFKKNLSINEEDFIISNVGGMTNNKGIDYLLVAFSILKQKYKNIKLILKDQSNLYKIKGNIHLEQMKKTKYSKYLDDRVLKDILFISENLSIKDLNLLYNITNCYVSPYRAEGFNLPPLEATACGTPIVVTKGGSTDEYYHPTLGLQIDSEIKKTEKIFFLKPKIDSLIQCISMIIENPFDYCGEEGIKFVSKNFSWEKVTNDLYNLMKI